jgi:hypothetical protein
MDRTPQNPGSAPHFAGLRAPTPLSPEAQAALEASIAEIETRLSALAQSLLERDSAALEASATDLQRALAHGLDSFTVASRHGAVPPPLRQRLVRASGQVAAHRDTLARATAALDRAIDMLLPRTAPVYNATGAAARPAQSGLAQA